MSEAEGGFEIAGVFFSYEWVQRFLSFCEPEPDSECIIWTGYKDRKGYGQFRGPITKSGMCKAHRLAYWLVRGPMFDDDTSEHECRNPSCVNPYHLAEMERGLNASLGNFDQYNPEVDLDRDEEEVIAELLEI